MLSSHSPLSRLAPLQEIMLRDSLAEPDAGHHVEQLDITFSRPLAVGTIVEAWRKTVADTDALRGSFDFDHGIPAGLRTVCEVPEMEIHPTEPDAWDSWFAADRCRPLLAAGEVPWRIVHWPAARQLVWTFHHALLDGRSISRILRGFLARLDGSGAETLRRSEWQPPTAEAVAAATRLFGEKFSHFVPARLETPPEPPSALRAVHCMGENFLETLSSRARREGSTPATFVTWAWGQALAAFTGASAVLVEQIRAGAPQPGTAGFTMNTLPLHIPRHTGPGREDVLRDFRKELLEMRRFETVSFEDFPAGVYPDLGSPHISTLMVEHATLPLAVDPGGLLDSIKLRERVADFPLATAHLQPGLRLEVEGPWKQGMLACWIAALEDLT